MTRPNWSEREDEIVRTLYPSLGARGCVRALGEEHFVRTEGATKERAKNLGVRRDMTKVTRKVENAWSEEELAILAESYPSGGASEAQRRLAGAGYDRTVGAVNVRASMMGIRSDGRKRRKVGDFKLVNICLDTELDREIIDRLDGQRNRSEYIRGLVRRDIEGR